MTFKVDNDALKVAMTRHYEEKLAKELREMFTYSGNEDTNRIWQLYLEELDRQEKQTADNQQTSGRAFAVVGCILIAYVLWQLFTHTPT